MIPLLEFTLAFRFVLKLSSGMREARSRVLLVVEPDKESWPLPTQKYAQTCLFSDPAMGGPSPINTPPEENFELRVAQNNHIVGDQWPRKLSSF